VAGTEGQTLGEVEVLSGTLPTNAIDTHTTIVTSSTVGFTCRLNNNQYQALTYATLLGSANTTETITIRFALMYIK
jgi:hypothetical protein